MAVSGLIMIGYLLAHMYGNLKVFAGPEAFNDYAHHLRTLGEPILPYTGLLWIIRVVLLVARSAHTYCRRSPCGRGPARPAAARRRYETQAGQGRCAADLRVLHPALGRGGHLLFVIYHLLHLTWNVIASRRAVRRARTTRVVNGFQIWWVVVAYTIAMIAVGFHLRHGTWSALTTLGANTSSRRPATAQPAGVRGGRHRHDRFPAPPVRDPLRTGEADDELLASGTTSARRRPTSVPWTPTRSTAKAPTSPTPRRPDVPIERRWDERRFNAKLVNPANRRKLSRDHRRHRPGRRLRRGHPRRGRLPGDQSFCYQDSPRRAHSIAAQGGINAAKNYRNDGDSIYRLFYDTVKGGDFRARESNVYRLAEVSVQIIDQCVAQGVPFAREYGGLLDNRSFGGVQVSRTFYARGQTGQQLLIGAYQALERQIAAGTVEMHTRHEMLELIVVDGRARGVVVRDMVTGEIETHFADAVVLATGGYGNVFFLSTNAMGCNVTATWRAHRKGAYFANPCYTQIHPTCIPVSGDYQSKLTLMSESLRNDGRIWVPKSGEDKRDPRRRSPRTTATTTWSGSTRRSATWCRATSPPGPRRTSATRAAASAPAGSGSTSTSPTRSSGWAARRSRPSTATCSTCTPRSPARTRTRRRCGSTRPCTTRWAGCGSTTTCSPSIPGLFVTGEANFSDHGANRLGASALMQGLADGYFVLPNTINDYLAAGPFPKVDASPPGGRRGGGARSRTGSTSCCRSTAPARSTRSTGSSATSCGTTAAWSAPRRACARRSAGSAS